MPAPVTSFSTRSHLRKRRRRRLFFISFSVFCATSFVAFFAYVVFFSSIFRISDVRVEGASTLSPDFVRSLFSVPQPGLAGQILFALGPSHMFGFPSHLDSKVLRDHPVIKSIEVQKHLFSHQVVLRVQERTGYGIWCAVLEKSADGGVNIATDIVDPAPIFLSSSSASSTPSEVPVVPPPSPRANTSAPHECFAFDEEGIIFQRSAAVSGNLIPVVWDYSQQGTDRLFLGARVLPGQQLSVVESIFTLLSAAHLGIAEFRIEDSALREAHIILTRGPRLLFSLELDPTPAVRIIDFLQQKGDFQKLSYIDFRVENRVYYK